LLTDQLDDAERDTLETHVGECHACQQTLSELSVQPAEWSRWQRLLRGAKNGSGVFDRTGPEGAAHQRLPTPFSGGTRTTSADETLDSPTGADHDRLARPSIPGYEILTELGRGGMGVVYKARQLSLDRPVALKMVLAGSHASPDQLARFRAEAESVARLQHPNIVQIHEIGQHAGLPYLSLEFVDGPSLAALIAGTPQPPRDAAALVEQLARAVQFAHERGIVHRDLKPANVLMQGSRFGVPSSGAERDRPEPTQARSAGEGRTTLPCAGASGFPAPIPELRTLHPKLTDFGLARQLDAARGLTHTGEVLGTPSYMAPEQVGPGRGAIGPATDIYTLGAILYELVTGRPPFKAATPIDTLMQVTLDEPVAPSRLQSKLPRDLETICLKCLAKPPRRRYGSAGELADDLRRFQQCEPIRARPARAWERAWKWSKRRPAAAALAAACVVSVAAILGVWVKFTTQLSAANAHAQSQADRAEAKAAEAMHQSQRADEQRAKALENFRRAREAVHKNLTLVSRDLRLQAFDLEPLRKQLLETAMQFYEQFTSELSDDPDLRFEQVFVLGALADLEHEVGDKSKAIDWYQRAIEIMEPLAAEQPANRNYLERLSTLQNNIGHTHRQLGQWAESLAAIESARAMQLKLLEADPTNDMYKFNLAASCSHLAALHRHAGRHDDVERLYREGLALVQGLPRTVPDFTQREAGFHHSLGEFYRENNRLEDAERELATAVSLREQIIARAASRVPEYHQSLFRSRTTLARLYHETSRAPAAESLLRTAIDDHRGFVRDFPNRTDARTGLASAIEQLATWLDVSGGNAEAAALRAEAKLLRDGAANLPESIAPAPSRNDGPESRGQTLATLGDYERGAGEKAHRAADPEKRDRHWRSAIEFYSRAVGEFESRTTGNSDDGVQRLLCRAYQSRATLSDRLGQHADALADCDRALAIAAPDSQLAIRIRRAAALAGMGRHEQAASELNQLEEPAARSIRTLAELAAAYAACAEAVRQDASLGGEMRKSQAAAFEAHAAELLCGAASAADFQPADLAEFLRAEPRCDAIAARRDVQDLLARKR
jgi:serine/threonine-protein kinase